MLMSNIIFTYVSLRQLYGLKVKCRYFFYAIFMSSGKLRVLALLNMFAAVLRYMYFIDVSEPLHKRFPNFCT